MTPITFDDVVPGDVIRFAGSASWWTVTETERGTYPQMVNLWLSNYISQSEAVMVSKLGADTVYKVG